MHQAIPKLFADDANLPDLRFHVGDADGATCLLTLHSVDVAEPSGVEPDQAAAARNAVSNHLEILAPAQDEAILREAGFSDPTLFYTGFTFRGWVAYA